jgi:cellulose synthase/poly-beta-1,6-N-acetylglucosamine synthase-like glycosyltransferase
MFWVLALWFALLAVFAGSYGFYFGYLRVHSKRPWGLRWDGGYEPTVSILVPAHNEQNVIRKKLENLRDVVYPREKLEVFVIDDASSDGTLIEVEGFVRDFPDFPLKIVKQSPRAGKAAGLNGTLGLVYHEVVVVTDADALWEKDLLSRALPYLCDHAVGAVSGRQVAGGLAQTWVAKGESSYLDLMSVLRLGESKIHSTIRFEGVFCGFKRACFKEFDRSGADDSGTALQVVENGFRAIFVPELAVPSEVPSSLGERTRVKTRRAVHLTGLWIRCLKSLVKGRPGLPGRIAAPEVFISLFDPLVFFVLACTTIMLCVFDPVFLVSVVVVLGFLALVPMTRSYLVHGILDQFVMLYSIFLCAARKEITYWEKS